MGEGVSKLYLLLTFPFKYPPVIYIFLTSEKCKFHNLLHANHKHHQWSVYKNKKQSHVSCEKNVDYGGVLEVKCE
jgi:hypothetical protein